MIYNYQLHERNTHHYQLPTNQSHAPLLATFIILTSNVNEKKTQHYIKIMVHATVCCESVRACLESVAGPHTKSSVCLLYCTIKKKPNNQQETRNDASAHTLHKTCYKLYANVGHRRSHNSFRTCSPVLCDLTAAT